MAAQPRRDDIPDIEERRSPRVADMTVDWSAYADYEEGGGAACRGSQARKEAGMTADSLQKQSPDAVTLCKKGP